MHAVLCVAVGGGGSAPAVLGACDASSARVWRYEDIADLQHSLAAHLAFPF